MLSDLQKLLNRKSSVGVQSSAPNKCSYFCELFPRLLALLIDKDYLQELSSFVHSLIT